MRDELMWTCLVWAERATSDNFWVPSHRFNSATGEQNGITQTTYTDSKPPSRMVNSLMPSTKLPFNMGVGSKYIQSLDKEILLSLSVHGISNMTNFFYCGEKILQMPLSNKQEIHDL